MQFDPNDTSESTEIYLLGQRLVLKADCPPERIEKLVTLLRTKIDTLSATSPLSATKLAILVALNIADDLLQAEQDACELRQTVLEKSECLLQQLEQYEKNFVHPPS